MSPKDRKDHYEDLWRNGVEFGKSENADRPAGLVGLEIWDLECLTGRSQVLCSLQVKDRDIETHWL